MNHKNENRCMVAALIASEIYHEVYDKLEFTSDTLEKIALWTDEFTKAHKGFDWEPYVMGYKEYPVKSNKWTLKQWKIDCWDSAISDFAWHKLEKLNS